MEPGEELGDKLEVECPLGYATAEDWAVPVTGEYQVWMGLFADGNGRRVMPSLSQLFVVKVN